MATTHQFLAERHTELVLRPFVKPKALLKCRNVATVKSNRTRNTGGYTIKQKTVTKKPDYLNHLILG